MKAALYQLSLTLGVFVFSAIMIYPKIKEGILQSLAFGIVIIGITVFTVFIIDILRKK